MDPDRCPGLPWPHQLTVNTLISPETSGSRQSDTDPAINNQTHYTLYTPQLSSNQPENEDYADSCSWRHWHFPLCMCVVSCTLIDKRNKRVLEIYPSLRAFRFIMVGVYLSTMRNRWYIALYLGEYFPNNWLHCCLTVWQKYDDHYLLHQIHYTLQTLMRWIVHKYLYSSSIVACKHLQSILFLVCSILFISSVLCGCVLSLVCVSPPRADLEEN